MIEGVLFDMDGLMFDTERLWTEAWLETAREEHLPVTLDIVVAMRGRTLTDCRQVCRAALGEDFDFDTYQEKARVVMARLVNDRGLDKKPGLVELLEELRRRGLPAVVCTSTRRNTTEQYLRMAGIGGFFKGQICGDEVTRGKPDPEVFLKGAALAGVAPERCIVLEDSPNGIRAGAAAGCKAVMVPDLMEPTDELRRLAAAIVPDLFAVIPLLSEL